MIGFSSNSTQRHAINFPFLIIHANINILKDIVGNSFICCYALGLKHLCMNIIIILLLAHGFVLGEGAARLGQCNGLVQWSREGPRGELIELIRSVDVSQLRFPSLRK